MSAEDGLLSPVPHYHVRRAGKTLFAEAWARDCFARLPADAAERELYTIVQIRDDGTEAVRWP